MNISIIGSGNVATALAKLALAKGHTILQIHSRNKQNAHLLAKEVFAEAGSLEMPILPNAEMVIMALNDDVLNAQLLQIGCGNALVVHTAASVPMDKIAYLSKNFGVLYPLQSLRKESTVITEIPLMIEANTPGNLDILRSFANTLSDNVQEVNSAQRAKQHVAAVFVSNFTNHLFALAEAYCKKENLDFNAFFPLIKETGLRIQAKSPSQLQTGPAMRHDDTTINKHIAYLSGYDLQKTVYELMTKSIQDFYKA